MRVAIAGVISSEFLSPKGNTDIHIPESVILQHRKEAILGRSHCLFRRNLLMEIVVNALSFDLWGVITTHVPWIQI